MHGFQIRVPADCIISVTPEVNRTALQQMRHTLKADVDPSSRKMPGNLGARIEELRFRVNTNQPLALVFLSQFVGEVLQYFQSGLQVACEDVMASR